MTRDKFPKLPKTDKPFRFVAVDPKKFTPPFDRITSVGIVPFLSDGRIVATLLERGIDIPGGHVQENEHDIETTARREALEEAGIDIADLRMIYILQSDAYGSAPHELTYIVILAARVTQLHPFTPQHEALGREIVTVEEFLARYKAGDKMMARAIMEAAA